MIGGSPGIDLGAALRLLSWAARDDFLQAALSGLCSSVPSSDDPGRDADAGHCLEAERPDIMPSLTRLERRVIAFVESSGRTGRSLTVSPSS